MKVQEITPAMLDKWIRALQKLGLSYNTISLAHAFIHHALDYAVYPAQLINLNPADYIKVPKNAPRNIVKRTIITSERFKTLLEKYPFGTPLYIPLLLLYHTEMRISKVLGLIWNDINFAEKKITLRRQIRYIISRGLFFTTLKTKSNNRYVLFLLGELRRWQNQQVENEKQFGDSYVYIYCENDGHIQRQSKFLPALDVEKVFLICIQNDGRLVLKESLTRFLASEGLNAHSFRHMHATQLIESGTTPKGVAGCLGHANTQITQNLYTHNTLKLQVETAEIFAQNLQTNS